MLIPVNSKVKFTKTADKNLDGSIGTVIGYYSRECIVLFDLIPKNYNPGIVISQSCLSVINSE